MATPSPSKKRASKKKASGEKASKKRKTAAKADKKPRAKGKSSKKSPKAQSKPATKLSSKKKAKNVGMSEKAAAARDKLAKKLAKKKKLKKIKEAKAAAEKKSKKAIEKSTPTKSKPPKSPKAAKKTTTKKSAESPLKSGGFKVPSKTAVMPQLNPKGNLVHHYSTLPGVKIYQFEKSAKPEPAFMGPFFGAVDTNPALQARVQSIGSFDVKAAPTIMESKTYITVNQKTKEEREYTEHQLLTVVGTNASKHDKDANWKAVAVEANRVTSTVTATNIFSTKTHMGEDKTLYSGPIAMDNLVMDEAIKAIITTAYPDNTFEEIASEAEIVGQFFADPEHGQSVLLGWAGIIDLDMERMLMGRSSADHYSDEEDSEEESEDDSEEDSEEGTKSEEDNSDGEEPDSEEETEDDKDGSDDGSDDESSDDDSSD